MSTTHRKLREIEAETRYITLDRVIFMLVTLLFTTLAMAFIVSAIAKMFTGVSQVLQHVAAFPH
jgi:hypothetical protein